MHSLAKPQSREQQAKDANPSQLGDPVSLKAETSDTEPTEQDRPNKADRARAVGKEGMDSGGETNKSQLGDPVSLKAEPSNTEVTEQDRGTVGVGREKERKKRDSKM